MSKNPPAKRYDILHVEYAEDTDSVVAYGTHFIRSAASPEQLWALLKHHKLLYSGKLPDAPASPGLPRNDSVAIANFLRESDPTIVPTVSREEHIKNMQEKARAKRIAKGEEELRAIGLGDLIGNI